MKKGLTGRGKRVDMEERGKWGMGCEDIQNVLHTFMK